MSKAWLEDHPENFADRIPALQLELSKCRARLAWAEAELDDLIGDRKKIPADDRMFLGLVIAPLAVLTAGLVVLILVGWAR